MFAPPKTWRKWHRKVPSFTASPLRRPWPCGADLLHAQGKGQAGFWIQPPGIPNKPPRSSLSQLASSLQGVFCRGFL